MLVPRTGNILTGRTAVNVGGTSSLNADENGRDMVSFVRLTDPLKALQKLEADIEQQPGVLPHASSSVPAVATPANLGHGAGNSNGVGGGYGGGGNSRPKRVRFDGFPQVRVYELTPEEKKFKENKF